MNRILNFSKRFCSPKYKEFNPSLDFCDVKEPDQALLDLIYGIDESTGLPIGDLSFYLGDKANPEIKLFIEQQLMRENPSTDGLSNLPSSVTNNFASLSDDDVAMFTRNCNESKEEYANRLSLYFAEEREKRARDKKQKQIDKLLNG